MVFSAAPDRQSTNVADETIRTPTPRTPAPLVNTGFQGHFVTFLLHRIVWHKKYFANARIPIDEIQIQDEALSIAKDG